MTERDVIVDQLKYSYEGLFNPNELYTVISSYFFEKGYDWYERMNQEQVTSEGRQVRIVFEPWKNASDYYKLSVKITLHLINIQDVEVEVKGRKLQLSRGVVKLIFDGYLVSDRNDVWTSPFYWFLSFLAERMFFGHVRKKFVRWVESDVEHLLHNIKRHLNAYKS